MLSAAVEEGGLGGTRRSQALVFFYQIKQISTDEQTIISKDTKGIYEWCKKSSSYIYICARHGRKSRNIVQYDRLLPPISASAIQRSKINLQICMNVRNNGEVQILLQVLFCQMFQIKLVCDSLVICYHCYSFRTHVIAIYFHKMLQNCRLLT